MITIDETSLTITVRTSELDGYPHADASEWADVREAFMRAARNLAACAGKPVEVYDEDGALLEQVA